MEPEAEKVTLPGADFFETLDHSVLQQPVNVGIKNVQQILSCIQNGNSEVQNIVLNECTIVYECKVCRNLFRALPNLIAHKRFYCKEPFCRVFKQASGSAQDETVVVQPEDAPQIDFEVLTAETNDGAEKTDETVEPQEIKFESSPIFTSTQKGSSEPKSKSPVDSSKDNSDQEHDDDDSASNVIQLQRIEGNPNAVFMSVAGPENPEKSGTKTPEEDKSPEEKIPEKETPEGEIPEDEVPEEDAITEDKNESKQITELRKNLDRSREKQLLKMTDCDVKTLTCLKCNKSFSSIKALYLHIQSAHAKKRVYYPCPLCKTSFAQIWGVTRHMSTVHRNSKEQINKFREHIVKKAFVKKIFQNDLERGKITPTTDNVCLKCGRVFLHKSSKINHERFCGESSSTNGKQKTAAKVENTFSPSHSCFKCGRVFEYKTLKEAHEKYCIGNQQEADEKKTDSKVAPMHSCLKCGRLFDRKTSQLTHTKFCQSNLSDQTSEGQPRLRSHKAANREKGTSRFPCLKCGRVFKLKSPQMSHSKHCRGKVPENEESSSEADVKPLEKSIGKKKPLETSTLKAILLEKGPVKAKNTKPVTPVVVVSSLSTRPKRVVGKKEDTDFVSSQSLKWLSANRVESLQMKQEPKENPSAKKSSSAEDHDSMLNVQELKDNKVIEGKVLSTINLEKLTCMRCQQRFASLSNAKRHVAIHHIGYMRYKCKHCTYKSYNKSDCRKHILRVHRKDRNGSQTDDSGAMLPSIKKEPGTEDFPLEKSLRRMPNPHVAVKKLNLPDKVDSIKVANLKSLDLALKKSTSPRGSVSKNQQPSRNLNMSNRPVSKQIFIRKPKPLILQNAAAKKMTPLSKQNLSAKTLPRQPDLSKKPMPLSKKIASEKIPLDLPKKPMPLSKKILSEEASTSSPALSKKPMPLSKKILSEGASTSSPDLSTKAMPLSQQNLANKPTSPSPQSSLKKPMPLSKKILHEETSPVTSNKPMPLSQKNLDDKPALASPQKPFRKAMPLSKQTLNERTGSMSPSAPISQAPKPLSQKNEDEKSTPPSQLDSKPKPLSKQNLNEMSRSSSPEDFDYDMPDDFDDDSFESSPHEISTDLEILSDTILADSPKKSTPVSVKTAPAFKPTAIKRPAVSSMLGLNKKPRLETTTGTSAQRAGSPTDPDDEKFKDLLESAKKLFSDHEPEDIVTSTKPPEKVPIIRKQPAWRNTTTSPFITKLVRTPAPPVEKKMEEPAPVSAAVLEVSTPQFPSVKEQLASTLKKPVKYIPPKVPPQKFVVKASPQRCVVKPPTDKSCTLASASGGVEDIQSSPPSQDHAYLANTQPQTVVLLNPPGSQSKRMYAVSVVNQESLARETLMLVENSDSNSGDNVRYVLQNADGGEGQEVMFQGGEDGNIQYIVQNPNDLNVEGQEVVFQESDPSGNVQYVVQNTDNAGIEMQMVSQDDQSSGGDVQYVVQNEGNTDVEMTQENDPISSDSVRYVVQNPDNNLESDPNCGDNVQYVLQQESDLNSGDNVRYVVQNADGTPNTSQVVFQGSDPITGKNVHYIVQNSGDISDAQQIAFQEGDPNAGDNVQYVVQEADNVNTEAQEVALQDPISGDTVQYVVQDTDDTADSETQQVVFQGIDPNTGNNIQYQYVVDNTENTAETQEVSLQQSDPVCGDNAESMEVSLPQNDLVCGDNAESVEVSLQQSDPACGDNAESVEVSLQQSDPVCGDNSESMEVSLQQSDPACGDNAESVEVSLPQSDPACGDNTESVEQNDENVTTSVEMQ